MKITETDKGYISKRVPKLKYIMKLCFVMLLFVTNPIGIENSYSQKNDADYVLHNVTIEQALSQVEKNTSYSFIYASNTLNLSHRVSINMKNKNINEIMNALLKGTGIQYRIVKKQIVLSEKAEQILSSNLSKKKITGAVIDSRGDPIIGASVIIRGSKNGTATDLNGRFTLSDVDNNDVLQVTSVGYRTATVAIKGKSNFNISLDEDTKVLDEVVVVGYGTMKKKDLTGAVTAIDNKELASRHATQLSTALQGAASGVTVTRDNDAPGATSSIVVRGITTISDSSPLVIIDGVPGDINQVNPDDVESMSILKDAASASIYGSRAAAGVILVTTKRAKNNDLYMTYSSEIGWSKPTTMPKYVGAQDFMSMTNETRYNDNNAGKWNQVYSQDLIDNYLSYNAQDPDKYPITDWDDLLYKKSASRQTHSFTIAGGGNVVRTKASFRYDKDNALYINRNYERYMLRINNDFQINKFLEAHLDVSYKRSLYKAPLINPYYNDNRKTPPIYAARWSNGLWGDVKDGANVLARLTDGGESKTWYNRVSAKAELDIKPFEGLKLSAVVAPTYNFDKGKTFRKQVPYTYADDPNTVKGYMQDFYTTMLTENRNESNELISQFFVNYTKSFGQHNIAAMAGYEDYYSFYENLSASRDQYELSEYPYLDLGPKDYRDNSGNAYEYAYRSFFGRINYSFADRYLLELNLRRDGSSRFQKNNRWANFPSVSAGWVISEENFMKKIDWLSHLKLRASWGRLGNERIGSYYPYQAAINFGSQLFASGTDIVSLTSAAQDAYAVRNITWETTETWDIGLDATFFNNRLSVTADYYNKRTKDMLLALEIPKFLGYDNPSVNAGKMHTSGFDLQINWNDQISDFKYSIGFNLSDFKSKMGDLNGTEFLGDQIKKQGSEYNQWYGYESDGLFLTQDDLNNSPKLNNNIKVGDVKYKDISGPDGVPDGKISPEYDRILLKGSLPHLTFGLNFNAQYKGFDFGMVLQGVGNQWARINSTMVEGLSANWCNFPELIKNKYWSEKNTDTQNAAARYPRLTRNNVSANLCMSDFWLFNGRYLRMKNLTLGYTLPTELTQKASIKTLRLYVSGNDLFCLSKFPKGWDPEVGSASYPITKSVVFGLSVNF